MIRDLFMSTGSFDLTLKPDTPHATRNALGLWDTIIVTPGPVAGTRIGAAQQTLATYLTKSIFTGRVTGQTKTGPGGRNRITGQSIVSWLGDPNGRGSNSAGDFTGSSTLGVRLIAMFNAEIDTNGISVGTTTSISTNNIDETSSGKESPRQALDRWCQMTTLRTEWRVTPAGTIDFTPYGTYNIFPGDRGISGTPAVLIGRGVTAERRSDLIVIPADTLTVDEDYSDVTTITHVEDSSQTYVGFANTLSGTLYSFDGSTVASFEAWHTLPTTATSNTPMTNTATALERDLYSTKYRYRLAVNSPLADILSPGARFWLWDPDTGQVDTANTVVAAGKQLQPVSLRCTGLTYGVHGCGVYGFNTSDASNTFVDLTDWIDMSAEPATTSVDVGSRQASLGRVMRRGVD